MKQLHEEAGERGSDDVRAFTRPDGVTLELLGALGLPEDEAVAIQTANARLIAASPDLKEATETLYGFLKLFVSREDEVADAVLKKAEAAIAKAEGRL